jgi:dipeptidyl aminopeptidase/acylaminoacyl peptidase
MAVLPSIERFLNVRSASAPTLSPDGRFICFLTNITGVSQVWQVPAESGWPTQLTFTSESVRGVHYSPRKHELIYSMDTGGNERTQLYRLYGIGGGTDHGIGEGWNTEDLTRNPKAIHTFGGWSHGGDRIAFSANSEDLSRFDIFVQEIGEQEAHLLQKGPGGYYSPVGWSPDDKFVLVRRMESNYNQDLYLIEVETGKVRHLTPHKGDAQYHSPSWSGDGKAVYCASTAGDRDQLGLAEIDVASAKLKYVESPVNEVEQVNTSPKGQWLVWAENIDGKSVLHLRNLKTGATKAIEGLPLGVISGLEFAQDDSNLALAFDGPRHNLDIWVCSLGNKKDDDSANRPPKQITKSSTAGLPFTEFVEPELIHYKTFDDRKIPAWFYKPNARGDRLPPVIVYPHGGPESQTRPDFSAIFQYFVQQGYAVLAPNVRGSTGYGVTFMNLDNTTKRMDSVKDLACAAYWLRDEKRGDPKRLAVYGGSYGGFMVLAQVTNYPELWAAGIDVVGIANFVTFMEKTGAYRRSHREKEYGNLRDHREFLEKISPINHVDKIKCPMMVIHGANDPRVPIGEAEQIVAALKKRDIPVEYLRYEDEGHGLAKLKNRLDAYPKMVEFLNKHLK